MSSVALFVKIKWCAMLVIKRKHSSQFSSNADKTSEWSGLSMLFVDYQAPQGIRFIVFRTMYNLAFLSKRRLFPIYFPFGFIAWQKRILKKSVTKYHRMEKEWKCHAIYIDDIRGFWPEFTARGCQQVHAQQLCTPRDLKNTAHPVSVLINHVTDVNAWR